MIDEYFEREDYAAATAVYLDAYNADPSEPMPLISLAGHKLHIEEHPEEAMRLADQAFGGGLPWEPKPGPPCICVTIPSSKT